MKVPQFQPGDRALYAGAWGTDAPRPCVITGRGEKHGKPVYDCRLDPCGSDDPHHWGYAEQFKPLRQFALADAFEIIARASKAELHAAISELALRGAEPARRLALERNAKVNP